MPKHLQWAIFGKDAFVSLLRWVCNRNRHRRMETAIEKIDLIF